VTGLTNGTSYTFTVTAKNAVGESAASAGRSATPIGAPSAPGNLQALAVIDGTAPKITVTWDPSVDKGGDSTVTYNLMVCLDSQCTGQATTTYSNVSSPYIANNLLYATTYYFKVTTSNSALTSLPVSTSTITPAQPPATTATAAPAPAPANPTPATANPTPAPASAAPASSPAPAPAPPASSPAPVTVAKSPDRSASTIPDSVWYFGIIVFIITLFFGVIPYSRRYYNPRPWNIKSR